jgi:hypothetical protein
MVLVRHAKLHIREVHVSKNFHANYNPDKDGDHISYADVLDLTFSFGTGQLQIYGNFTTTGSRTV